MADAERQPEGNRVGEPMSKADARRLTDQIKHDAKALWDKVIEAYDGRADIALDYDSWDAYCAAEFSSMRLRLPREERQAVVKSLRESGMSIRATASAIGISEGTVRNDQKSDAQNYAPDEDAEIDEDELTEQLITCRITERITHLPPTEFKVIERPTEPPTQLTLVTRGLDGKQYASTREPSYLRPMTLAEHFERGMDALDRSIDQLSRLVAEASDAQRAELASRWADMVVDRAARLSAILNHSGLS